jgi:hypothetical protein
VVLLQGSIPRLQVNSALGWLKVFGELLFGSSRLTGALLDCLTHHVHILEMNGDSFRLKHSKRQITDDQSPQEQG